MGVAGTKSRILKHFWLQAVKIFAGMCLVLAGYYSLPASAEEAEILTADGLNVDVLSLALPERNPKLIYETHEASGCKGDLHRILKHKGFSDPASMERIDYSCRLVAQQRASSGGSVDAIQYLVKNVRLEQMRECILGSMQIGISTFAACQQFPYGRNYMETSRPKKQNGRSSRPCHTELVIDHVARSYNAALRCFKRVGIDPVTSFSLTYAESKFYPNARSPFNVYGAKQTSSAAVHAVNKRFDEWEAMMESYPECNTPMLRAAMQATKNNGEITSYPARVRRSNSGQPRVNPCDLLDVPHNPLRSFVYGLMYYKFDLDRARTRISQAVRKFGISFASARDQERIEIDLARYNYNGGFAAVGPVFDMLAREFQSQSITYDRFKDRMGDLLGAFYMSDDEVEYEATIRPLAQSLLGTQIPEEGNGGDGGIAELRGQTAKIGRLIYLRKRVRDGARALTAGQQSELATLEQELGSQVPVESEGDFGRLIHAVNAHQTIKAKQQEVKGYAPSIHRALGSLKSRFGLECSELEPF